MPTAKASRQRLAGATVALPGAPPYMVFGRTPDDSMWVPWGRADGAFRWSP